MGKLLYTTPVPTLYARLVTGCVFLSEGVQKFILPAEVGEGRFAKIGFGNPAFWAVFTGSFEIACSLLVLPGLLTRVAAIPLLVIMATAFITTKWLILVNQGFWHFAHEYRTDFAMTLLLLFLLVYGGGKNSLDLKLFSSIKK